MKICYDCGLAKLEFEFYKDKSKKDGLRGCCKLCDNARTRAYARANPDRLRKYRVKAATLNPEAAKARSDNYRFRHPARKLVCSARGRARVKKVAFDLDDYLPLIEARMNAGVCELTGFPLDLQAKKAFNSPSIDRINPKEGYTYKNIRIVCYAMNCALGTWGPASLMKIVSSWIANEAKKNH